MSLQWEGFGNTRKTKCNVFPDLEIPLRRCLPDLHRFLEELTVAKSFLAADIGHGLRPALLGLEEFLRREIGDRIERHAALACLRVEVARVNRRAAWQKRVRQRRPAVVGDRQQLRVTAPVADAELDRALGGRLGNGEEAGVLGSRLEVPAVRPDVPPSCSTRR